MNTRFSPVKSEDEDRSVNVGEFVLTETFRPPGKIIPLHCHERANIAFVLSGTFLETVGHKPFELDSNSVVFRPAGEAHKNHYGAKPARSFIIEVGRNCLETMREYSDLLDRSTYLRDSQMARLGFRIYHEFKQMDAVSPLAIEGLILEILAYGVRRKEQDCRRKKPRWLERALDFIHADFSEPVSLSGIAEMSGVHPAHLAKVFRRHFNCTMGEYVRRLRLEEAERKLITTDLSLSEIALSVGFYDQSHFANLFKHRYGLPPSEFRVLRVNK